MDEFDAFFLHIIKELVSDKRAEDTTIAVRCLGNLIFIAEDNLSLFIDCRKTTLLEEFDCVFAKAKVVFHLEEFDYFLVVHLACHDIPSDKRFSEWLLNLFTYKLRNS